MRKTFIIFVLSLLFTNISFAQSYLNKKIVYENNFLKKDIKNVVKKARKPLRFRSRNCNTSIDYLTKLEDMVKGDTASYIMKMCDFDIDNYKLTKIKYRNIDKKLLENILKNNQIKSMNNEIDDYRFLVAVQENNLEALYGYLECKYFMAIGCLKHKQEVDSLIFIMSNPTLYELAPHYQKLNDLILFLENERNYNSSYYFEALYSLYLIYTNDGECETINLLTSYNKFNTCKQRCDKKDTIFLNTVIANDLKQCKIYDSLKNIKFPETKIMDEFIRNNLPKESAYKMLQKRISKEIDNNELIKARCIFNDFIAEIKSKFILFPEMQQKLELTSSLLQDQKIIQSIPLLENKGNIGFGQINNIFLTDSSVIYSIGGGYNNLAKEGPNFSENNAILQGYNILDMNYTENEICIQKNTELLKLSTSSGESIFPLIIKDKCGKLILKNNPQKIIEYKTIEYSPNNENFVKYISIANGNSKGFILCMENSQNFNKWSELFLNSELDIYTIPEIGEYPIAINKHINTRYSENSAFLINDTLYFSSNGLYGFGGYDIYMSIKSEDGWSFPKNLGAGINTIYDDISYRRIDGNDVFICDTSAPNGKTIALTSSKIDPQKEVYTMKVVLPESIKTTSPITNTITVYIIDENNERIPVRHSFYNDDGKNRYIYITLGEEPWLPKLEIVKYGKFGIDNHVVNSHNFDPKDIYCKKDKVYIKYYDKALSFIEANKPIINGHDKNSYTYTLSDYPRNIQPNIIYPIKWEVAFPKDSVIVYLTQEVKISEGEMPIMEFGKYEKVIEVKSVKQSELTKGNNKQMTVYFDTDERSITSYNKYKNITSTLNEIYRDMIFNYKKDVTNWVYNENENDIILIHDFEGWADTTHTPSYNYTLSIDRANATHQLITDTTINPKELKYLRTGNVSGKGETSKFGKGLKENRRVNITIKWL